jgi:hypothetical protein
MEMLNREMHRTLTKEELIISTDLVDYNEEFNMKVHSWVLKDDSIINTGYIKDVAILL